MSTVNTLLDAKTVSSGGGTKTSSSEGLAEGQDRCTIWLEGDSNSSDVDIEIQVKQESSGSWLLHDRFTNRDLTRGNTNNESLPTTNLKEAVDTRVHLTNNAGSDTDVTVKIKEV